MRMALVISTLGPGGAEHIMTMLANHLAGRGHHVDMITLDSPDNSPHYRLHQNVRLHPLGRMGTSSGPISALFANMGRIRALRKAFLKLHPDVILSFLTATNILSLLAASGTEYPVVVAERASLQQRLSGTPWILLRYITYPRAKAVVVQTQGEQKILHELIPCTNKNSVVIPNPVARPTRTTTGHGIIFVGRFSEEKRPMDVLEAFALARKQLKGRTLTMVGDGPLRQAVESRVQALGLSQAVCFTGVINSVDEQLIQNDIFALSSAHEGFPNALCEAMAHGLACIATNSPGGCTDIMQHEHNGLLVPAGEIRHMADAMTRLATDDQLRTGVAANAMSICEKFDNDHILCKWMQLLVETGASACAV